MQHSWAQRLLLIEQWVLEARSCWEETSHSVQVSPTLWLFLTVLLPSSEESWALRWKTKSEERKNKTEGTLATHPFTCKMSDGVQDAYRKKAAVPPFLGRVSEPCFGGPWAQALLGSLQGLVQSENVRFFVHRFLRILKWWQQRIKPSTGPRVAPSSDRHRGEGKTFHTPWVFLVMKLRDLGQPPTRGDDKAALRSDSFKMVSSALCFSLGKKCSPEVQISSLLWKLF